MKIKKSVTLNKDVIEQIKQLAKAEGVSFSEYVNNALKEQIMKSEGDNKS